MKILEINSVPYGSTCHCMIGIAESGKKNKVEVHTASGYSYHPVGNLPKNHIAIGGVVAKFLHIWMTKITGYHGMFSIIATWNLLRKIKKEKYSIIHFHNLHGWYINLKMITDYVKKHKLKVVWTLHDCWAFTGQCPYYTLIRCDKWKTQCHSCPQYKEYPSVYIDRSKEMYKLKMKWFQGMDAVLVTPSQWLAEQTKQSFLKDYPVKVINNGINLEIFKPTDSNFRENHNISKDKFILLGIAFDWGPRKGLDVFIELAKRLDDRFQIVLVGTDDKIAKQLPENIISIHRTQNQHELAEIYTAADLFVNPTREENYPTVNMEAIACGTPVLTFKTGGSPEILDENTGSWVSCDDIDALVVEILRISNEKPYSVEACVNRAKDFDMYKRFEEYIELYKEKTC